MKNHLLELKSRESISSVDYALMRDGSLYITAKLYRNHFDALQTLMLVRRDADLMILPVRHVSVGGYILKLLNRDGDRVAHAPDFWRVNSVTDQMEILFPVRWNNELSALVGTNVFPRKSYNQFTQDNHQ